jgi:hypothetical protein
MTSDCERFEVEVGMRQHGALDEARIAALEAHLAGCPSCRQFAATTSLHTTTLRQEAARDAAAVDWTRVHDGVRALRRSQRTRLWLAPLILFSLPLALLVSGGRFHDPKLYLMFPAGNLAIYLAYVYWAGRPFREVLAVAKSGTPLLAGYARELRRLRLRTWFFVAWNGSAALFMLGAALVGPGARLRLFASLCALGFGAWTAYDLRKRLPRIRRALAEVA